MSTFLNVTLGGGRYVFMLVTWVDFANEVRDEVNRQADAFGLALGAHGTFVQAYPATMLQTGQEVREKEWPEDISERFQYEQEPILLVLDRAWKEFEPSEHPYAIVWLSGFNEDPKEVRGFLQQIAMRTRRRDDVIEYLHDLAKDARRTALLDKADQSAKVLARVASYVEIKPTIFGISVDLKAILRDIAQRQGR